MDFVEARNKFSILRRLLGAIGLSPEAVDDSINRITDFLSDKGEIMEGAPAGHNFFSVLKTTICRCSASRSSHRIL